MTNPNEYPGQGNGPGFQSGGQDGQYPSQGGYPPPSGGQGSYPHSGGYPQQGGQYGGQQGYGQQGQYQQQYGQGYDQQSPYGGGQGYGEEPPRGGGAVKWVSIIAAIVLVVGGAIGAFLWFGGDEEEPTTQPSASQPAEETPSEDPSEDPGEDPTSEEPSEDPTSEEPSEEPTPEQPAEEPTSEEPAPSDSPSADTPSEEPTTGGETQVNVSLPGQIGDWKFNGDGGKYGYYTNSENAVVSVGLKGAQEAQWTFDRLENVAKLDDKSVCGTSSSMTYCFLVNSQTPEGVYVQLYSSMVDVEGIRPIAEAIVKG